MQFIWNVSRWIELITPLPSLLIRLISVQPPCLKGDFQVLSDLALASPSHPGHPLHLQSRCPAWVFSGTWLYLFLLLGPLFPQVVAGLCPHFRQRSAQRTCVQRIYYHAICHSPPTFLIYPVATWLLTYFIVTCFLLYCFSPALDCKPHVGWDFGHLALFRLGWEHNRIYLSVYLSINNIIIYLFTTKQNLLDQQKMC